MLTKWMAGAREYRLALIVATTGSLILALLLIAPSWILPEQSSVDNKGTRTRAPAYNLPVRPSQEPAAQSKTSDEASTLAPDPHKTEKQVVPQVKKVQPPEISSPHHSSVTVQPPKNRTLAYGYYVQAGAFKNAVRAKKLARSLQHAGWHMHTMVKNKGLHAVLAGPFQSRKKAESAKLKLAKRSGIKGFILFNTSGN